MGGDEWVFLYHVRGLKHLMSTRSATAGAIWRGSGSGVCWDLLNIP